MLIWAFLWGNDLKAFPLLKSAIFAFPHECHLKPTTTTTTWNSKQKLKSAIFCFFYQSFFIKAPLFFLLFTLHQIGWNPDKHWGCERWRVTHHSSPLFTFGRRFSIHRFSQISRVKSGWRVVKSRAQLFTRANSLATDIYAISVKSEECFWSSTVKVFREKFWRLGDKVLSLPSD